MPSRKNKLGCTDEDALHFHTMHGKPGKLEICPTKPMATQRDLSLAYSPGVAAPVRAIAEDPGKAYDYTNKGNLVAVISNGTAILGLGDLGALASKPVMEGKAVLFKRFADVDSIDIEIDTTDAEQFINSVRYLGPSFGGINLEDISAPDCFIIEQKLREVMDIPVFHDDQHGTAIISAAGLINAIDLTGRNIKDIRMVVNGAGAAAIACIELAKSMGVPHRNVTLCDSKGVIYKGRQEGMNQWKSAHAIETKDRTLEEAMTGADVLYGLSVAGAISAKMVDKMAVRPIIFAMANPDPEITPEEVLAVRPDAIMATGRSDYPNQVNNVLGFPYIFRGALDVQASAINDAMKIAAAQALAELARENVPDEVAAAYQGERPHYGPEYIIPAPFDPRLIEKIPAAVARAAMDTGVANKLIIDMDAYEARLSGRLNPAASTLQTIFAKVRRDPKRVVFAEGEEEQVVHAAYAFLNAGLGQPVLVGRAEKIEKAFEKAGIKRPQEIEIQTVEAGESNKQYVDFFYERNWRKGFLYRDCARLVRLDRNVFSSCMVGMGHADAMVTGLTRNWYISYKNVQYALDPKPGRTVIGVTLTINKGRTVLLADTAIHETPSPEQLADIAIEAAAAARRFGYEPRVALLAYSTFGYPKGQSSERMKNAVKILDQRGVNFEYDGEMAADVALSAKAMALYPNCRLSQPANVLIMPGWNSASVSTKMLETLGGSTVIGPMLVGLEKPVQIAKFGASDSDLVNLAAIAAYDAADKS
ncbi:MAG: NADP-dependent malic enzyme [bacterium]|nr:NADP-dependent malic enzyme [bacterium]